MRVEVSKDRTKNRNPELQQGGERVDYCVAIQRFCDYVENRLEEGLTKGFDRFDLEEAIASTHISMFHFYRIFKVITGLTVLDYVKRRRLGLAARHLLLSGDDILTTAISCGFQSGKCSSAISKNSSAVPRRCFGKSVHWMKSMEKRAK